METSELLTSSNTGPFRSDIGDRFYFAEETINVSQRCLMVFRRIGGCSISYKNDVVVADKSLARSRLDANIGGNTRQNYRTDPVWSAKSNRGRCYKKHCNGAS